VLAKGPSGELKRLADKLIGAKGVIAGDVSGLAIVGAGQKSATKPKEKRAPSKASSEPRPHKH